MMRRAGRPNRPERELDARNEESRGVESREAQRRVQNNCPRHRHGLDGAQISDYVASVLIGVNQLGTLLSVVIIDVVLAGDNAIVVGMAAAGLPAERRRRIIVLGIAAATVLRIFFAYFAVQLLAVIGLTLAGGVLLLWVSWKMYREIRETKTNHQAELSGMECSGTRLPMHRATPTEALARVVLGGCFDVTRQRTVGSRDRTRSFLAAGVWACAFGGADGGRLHLYRQAAGSRFFGSPGSASVSSLSSRCG